MPDKMNAYSSRQTITIKLVYIRFNATYMVKWPFYFYVQHSVDKLHALQI